MDFNKFFLKLKKNIERVFIFVRNSKFFLKLKELWLNLNNVFINVFIIIVILCALVLIFLITEINCALIITVILLLLYIYWYIHWVGKPFRNLEYKIKNKNYYSNKNVSYFMKINPLYLIFISILFIVLFFVFKLGGIGTLGSWLSAIGSLSAVLFSLWRTLHVDNPNLNIELKKQEYPDFLKFSLDIINIDSKAVCLKCIESEGVYMICPKSGNWENKVDYSNIDLKNVSEDRRKEIFKSILLLESINGPHDKNKKGSLSLIVKKDTPAFRIVFVDLISKKEIFVSARRDLNWELSI